MKWLIITLIVVSSAAFANKKVSAPPEFISDAEAEKIHVEELEKENAYYKKAYVKLSESLNACLIRNR